MRDREALARELSNALREKLHWTYDDRALLSLVLIELVHPEQPTGYWKLPSMMSCRCEKLIRDANGDSWCCTPYQEDS